jgi:hypothetical protein
MHFSSGLISTIVNFLIIFFVIRMVSKAVKKKSGMNTQDKKEDYAAREKKQTIIEQQPHPKDLKHEYEPIYNPNIQLKRCANCGGEIPITMLKCTICGQRQAGCSAAVWVIILAIAALALILYLQGNGVPVSYYFNLILDKLSGY